MTVIKRYSNRKLYDTERKRYITLEGIAVLVRQGEDISVIDKETGDDITNQVLSQVILEQQKQRAGYIPKSILTALIKASDSTIDTLKRRFNDSIEYLRKVDEEIDQRIVSLVDRGELAFEDAQEIRRSLLNEVKSGKQPRTPTQDEVEKALDTLGVPSREQVENLSHQIDELNAKIEALINNKP